MRIAIIGMILLLAACGTHNAAQREQINATQALVDQKTYAGEMTPAEARAIMANLKASQASERRRNAIAMEGPAVYQPVGGGTYVRF